MLPLFIYIHLNGPGQIWVPQCSAPAMLWSKGTPQSNGRTNRAGNRRPGRRDFDKGRDRTVHSKPKELKTNANEDSGHVVIIILICCWHYLSIMVGPLRFHFFLARASLRFALIAPSSFTGWHTYQTCVCDFIKGKIKQPKIMR